MKNIKDTEKKATLLVNYTALLTARKHLLLASS